MRPGRQNIFAGIRLTLPVLAVLALLAFCPTPAAAQKIACDMLTPTDVKPLVPGNPKGDTTESGTTCVWGDIAGHSGKPWLMLQALKFNSAKFEDSFNANRAKAFGDYPATAKDEPKIGRRAYSAITERGVELVFWKKYNLVSFQYFPGRPGTAADLDLLRVIATKIAATL